MTKKRDNAYLKKRLAKEFPGVFADFDAGRIKSVRAAAAKAGLIHLPTRLDALKREWKKATQAEQHEFILWAKARVAKARGVPV